MPAYSPRIVDGELLELLGSAGAVVIEGPKACAARNYLEQVWQVDISRVDRRRDPARVGALLRSLGRRCRPGRAHRDLRQGIWLSPARWGCGGAGWCPWALADGAAEQGGCSGVGFDPS
ncbi:MAG: hypothetical protein NWR94_05265, partial [Cyanobium sp. MAG_237]|nr:hypothetical protein [Cyanobium sp. MAG_237]